MKRTESVLDFLFNDGVDIRKRKVYIQYPFDEEDVSNANPYTVTIRALHYLDSTEGDIDIFIDTAGGYVHQMYSLYDTIRGMKRHVNTIGLGQIYSAGCLVLVAGDHRKATPNTTFMSHDTEISFSYLKYPDAISRIAEHQRERKRWLTLMAKHTKHTVRWWEDSLSQGELWMDAKDMKKHGIIDEIIEPEE